MSGFYDIATIIYILNEVYSNIIGSLITGCDSEMAMYKTLPATRLKSSLAHYDLAFSICSLILKTPIKWSFFHVRRHQDRSKSVDDLDLQARLNIRCDYHAGIFCQLAEWKQFNPTSLLLFNSTWRVILNDIPVVNDINNKLI